MALEDTDIITQRRQNLDYYMQSNYDEHCLSFWCVYDSVLMLIQQLYLFVARGKQCQFLTLIEFTC